MRTIVTVAALAVVCALTLYACVYAPHPPDGALACSTDGQCPDGYSCLTAAAGARRCFANGGPGVGTGGQTGAGGAVGGTGGMRGTGGVIGSGGALGTGGRAVGGTTGTGGRGVGGGAGVGGRAVGGMTGTGGVPGTGGVSGTGGVTGTGGTGTGGVVGTGGSVGTPPTLANCVEVNHDDTPACGTVCTTAQDAIVYGLAFSPDGTLMVTGGSDGRLKVWRVANRTVTPEGHVFAGTSDAISAFSPNGTLLAVGRSGGIQIYNVATWTIQITLAITGSVFGVAFTPDGTQVVSMDSTTLYVHALTGTQPLHTAAVANPWALAVSPTGTAGSVPVAVATTVGTALVFSLTSTGFSLPTSLVVTSDASYAEAIAFSPQGNLLASGGDDGFLHVWNVPIAGGSIPPDINIAAATSDTGWVNSIAFSPNGSYLAVGGGFFGAVATFSTAPPRTQIGTAYEGVNFDVVSMAVSPDGGLVVGGEKDCGCVVVCPQ